MNKQWLSASLFTQMYCVLLIQLRLAYILHFQSTMKTKNASAFKMAGDITLFSSSGLVHIFTLIFSHLTFVLDLGHVHFLWGIVNLAHQTNYLLKLASSLIHQFHLVIRSRALPDCVPRFWWKVRYSWSWQCSRVHQQYRRARHPSSDPTCLSPWHHMSWRQCCCCWFVSLLSLSSTHSSCIRALSLNLGNPNKLEAFGAFFGVLDFNSIECSNDKNWCNQR